MLLSNIHFQFTRCDPVEFRAHSHTHKCYELIYYFSGNGYCDIGNKRYDYAEHNCVIIPPNTKHNDFHLEPCRLFCLGFSIARDKSLPSGVFPDRNQSIMRYVEIISSEFKDKPNDYISVAHNCMNNIIIEINRMNEHTINAPFHPNAIEFAIDYIEKNFQTDISLKTLSEITNYSYDRFRHIFHHAIGISPKQYILDKRLEHAKKLLSTTSLPITEIAYQCGFSSSSLFAKQFKNKTDLSPIRYRQQLSSNQNFSSGQSTYQSES